MPPPKAIGSSSRAPQPSPARAAAAILAAGVLTATAILANAVRDAVPPPSSPLPIEAPTTTMQPWTPDGH